MPATLSLPAESASRRHATSHGHSPNRAIVTRSDVVEASNLYDTHSANATRLRRVTQLSKFLDTAVRIPGLGVRVGADAALGLVPVIGDITSLVISGYIVREAYKAGLGLKTLIRMVANIGIDAIVGAIPFVGDTFDVFFRANRRNAKLLREGLANLER